jgi:mono/diheme cytochrome c family protein
MGLFLLAFAQEPQLKTRAIPPTNPADGQQMYFTYCASCHGPYGKGDGPVATVLKHPIPDLSTIAQRNGGLFPWNKVETSIAGDPQMPSHGTADMPVWGPLLSDVSHQDHAQVHQRLYNLVGHVKSLQVEEQKAQK